MGPNSIGGSDMLPWIDASNGRGPKPALHLAIAGSAAIAAATTVVLLAGFKWLKKSLAAVPAKETPTVHEEAQPLLPPGAPRFEEAVVKPESASKLAETASAGVDELKQGVKWLRLEPPGPTTAAKDAGEASSSGSKKEPKS